MQSINEHIPLLTNLLPRYRSVNLLYQEIVDKSILSFDAQCIITDFYNEFNNVQAFEKSILNFLLSTDKEKQSQIISNLRTEIDGQVKDTNKLWQELAQVRNSLESASWNNDKIGIERLTREEEKIEGLYKKEQEKLNALYQQQKDSDNHAAKYLENVLGMIHELGCSFISLLNNYFPIEKEKKPTEVKLVLKPGVYFDMKLVSLIHNECNNIQFENLSELDLYAILNLQSTNAKLTVKSGERTRMCFLIYKLYEYLKTDNRTEWRTNILESAGIDKKYYDSKYKEPESEIPSRKSESFAQRINKIFEYIF